MHGAIAEKSLLLINELRIKIPPAGRNDNVSISSIKSTKQPIQVLIAVVVHRIMIVLLLQED